MKKSTTILIIAGVTCTIIGVGCTIAAVAKASDLGYDFAKDNNRGDVITWHIDSNTWDDSEYSNDKVSVHLPFFDVNVDGDKVDVNLPGMKVNVDENGKVDVKISDETNTSTSESATDTSTSQSATDTSTN